MLIYLKNFLIIFAIIVGVNFDPTWGFSTNFKFELDNPSSWIKEHNEETNFYEMMDFAGRTSQFIVEALQNADSQPSQENKIKIAFQALGYLKMMSFDLRGDLVCKYTKSEVECHEFFQHEHTIATLLHMTEASHNLEKFMWLFGTAASKGLDESIHSLKSARDGLKILTIANSDLNHDSSKYEYLSKLLKEVDQKYAGNEEKAWAYDRVTYFGIHFVIGSFLFYLLFTFSMKKFPNQNILKKCKLSL